jgi:SAM-dependent methyltransferase
MSASLGDVYHVARDDAYLQQLQAEAEFWDRPQFFSLDIDMELPVVSTYINRRFTGDENVGWFDTISRYGEFQRGCSLGTGALKAEIRMLQQNPALHLTFYDISGESLKIRESQLGAQFPGRVATHQVDLNFIELADNAYDLIVSAACMHHLLNLEHIAYQINRALTPSGTFFLYDYVGEARFQFAEEKKRFVEAVVEEARSEHPLLSSWHFVWSDLSNWDNSPFEAMRSDETLQVFRQYLAESSLRPGGSLVRLLFWLKPLIAEAPVSHGWRRLLPAGRRQVTTVPEMLRIVAPDLLWLDSALTDTGIFQPWDAFAVYRKRQHEARPA